MTSISAAPYYDPHDASHAAQAWVVGHHTSRVRNALIEAAAEQISGYRHERDRLVGDLLAYLVEHVSAEVLAEMLVLATWDHAMSIAPQYLRARGEQTDDELRGMLANEAGRYVGRRRSCDDPDHIAEYKALHVRERTKRCEMCGLPWAAGVVL